MISSKKKQTKKLTFYEASTFQQTWMQLSNKREVNPSHTNIIVRAELSPFNTKKYCS